MSVLDVLFVEPLKKVMNDYNTLLGLFASGSLLMFSRYDACLFEILTRMGVSYRYGGTVCNTIDVLLWTIVIVTW